MKLRSLSPLNMLLGLYVILFFVFMLTPILIVTMASFSDTNFVTFPIKGFTLRWFQRVWDYEPFRNSFILSIEVALASAVVAIVLGVPAALYLVRSRNRSAQWLMGFLLSPLSMPAIVIGFSLLFFLSAIGLPMSFASLLIAHSVVSIPYIVRTVGGIYRGTSTSYEEAATILGAGRWQTFRFVTLPMIRPAIFAGCLFSILISIDNLPISFFFSSTDTNLLPVVILSYTEYQFDPSVAAACTVQLVFAIILMFIVDRLYGLRRMVTAL